MKILSVGFLISLFCAVLRNRTAPIGRRPWTLNAVQVITRKRDFLGTKLMREQMHK